MNHLHEKTKAFIESINGENSVGKKIEYVQKTLWVGYSSVKEIEGMMNDILNHPKINRMPNLLVLARTNNGKSSLLRRFALKNKAVRDEEGFYLKSPVLGFLMPEGPTEMLFADALLRTVSILPKRTETYRDRISQVYNMLENVECKVILIDEIHHIAQGAPRQQKLLMNLMKNISSHFGLSFIAAGTAEARNIFTSDEQLHNRFPQAIIPLWDNDDELKSLLHGFELLLPFEEPSGLVGMSEFILSKTDRTIGDIYSLLKATSILAIKTGQKSITRELIKKCNHKSPEDHLNDRKKTI